VDAVQAQDVGIALLLHQRPIVSVASHPEAVFGGIVETYRQIGGVPHHFLRHTTDVHARSAQPARFDQSHPGAVFSGTLGRSQPAAATPNHNQVILVGHVAPATSDNRAMLHGRGPAHRARRMRRAPAMDGRPGVGSRKVL